MVNVKAPWALPDRFKAAIKDSDDVLKGARRGISIFESDKFRRGAGKTSLPFFETASLKRELDHFLDLSVAMTTYTDAYEDKTKMNVAQLISNSPAKTAKKVPKTQQ